MTKEMKIILRYVPAIATMIGVIFSTSFMNQRTAVESLWFLSAWIMAVGSAFVIYVHWMDDRFFGNVVLWKLVTLTAVHIMGSIIVVWWLSITNDTQNGAAFIATVAYAPSWYLFIRAG